MDEPTVYINGLFMRQSSAKVSIMDRGFCYGDGLFETIRVNKGKIYCLDKHIDRLFNSLPQVLIDLPMTQLELIKLTKEILARNEFKNAIIRLEVTRGDTQSNIEIDYETHPNLIINIRPYVPLPKTVYKRGVRVMLFYEQASLTNAVNKRLKSCNYLSNILLKEISNKKNCMEGIVVDPNFGVTEGTTSNIFIVENGQLKTPPLSPYVLSGITRQIVIDIARDNKIPIFEEQITKEELLDADEIFITSSGIEIVPVTQVDSISIANKKPGILTKFMHDEYLNYVEGEKISC